MGQRLVISIHKNHNDEKSFAKIYYHWSAYTVSALYELKNLIDNLPKNLDVTNNAQLAKDLVTALEKNTASSILFPSDATGGLSPNDEEFYEHLTDEKYSTPHPNRNYGLISFSEEEQARAQSWSERDIILYLDTMTFEFQVFFDLTTYEFNKTDMIENVDKDTYIMPVDENGELSVSDIETIIEENDNRPYLMVNNELKGIIS